MGRRIAAEQNAVLGQPDPDMLGDVALHGHDAQGDTLAITRSRGRSTSMVGGKLSGSLGSGTGDGPIPFPTVPFFTLGEAAYPSEGKRDGGSTPGPASRGA